MILLNHLILLCILSHPNLITATPPSNSIRARYLFSSTTSSSIDPVYSNSTKIFPTIANLSSSSSSSTVLQGRYGHSTTYLASSNQLYFIGGQFGDTGTQISNQILVFNLNQDYPASSNPRVDPIVSLLLPPNAWGAITTDTAQRIWSIGGITQNCEKDSIAYVLAGEAWIAVRATPHPPPRRRQAQGVTVRNTVSKLDEIWVFGGIAEPFTCSLETIGYLGYDRWSVGKVSESSATMIVESSEWIAPVGTVEHYSPPVSDFTATLLQDGSNIVVIGGQSSDGVLLSMKQILVFDTTSGVWSLQVRRDFLSFKFDNVLILIVLADGKRRDPYSTDRSRCRATTIRVHSNSWRIRNRSRYRRRFTSSLPSLDPSHRIHFYLYYLDLVNSI